MKKLLAAVTVLVVSTAQAAIELCRHTKTRFSWRQELMKLTKTFCFSLGLVALGATALSGTIVVLNDLQPQTVAGEDFNFLFSPVPVSDGTDGVLTLHARGDYDPNTSTEFVTWDIDSLGIGANAGPTIGGVMIIQNNGINDVEWSQDVTIAAADMLTITGDALVDILVDLNGDQSAGVGVGFQPDEFFEVTLTYKSSPTPATCLDIKPGSCPNPVNRSSMGFIPMALTGSDDLDAIDIDIASLELARSDGVGGTASPWEGPPGPHTTIADVATPTCGDAGEPCGCTADGADGNADLVMHFSTPVVVEALELSDVEGGTELELCIAGTLLDGTSFDACDCVRIVPTGDLDGNLTVNGADLVKLMAAWGTDPVGSPDFDGNGIVSFPDLLILLGNWG